MGAKG